MIAGIYKFTNLINNKVYIGSSNNIERRLSSHMFYKTGSKPLYNALLKYTMDNFKLEILERYDPSTFNTKLEFGQFLYTREQIYLDQYYAQEYITSNNKDKRFLELTYNLSPEAKGNRGTTWKQSEKALYNKRKWNKEHPMSIEERKRRSESYNTGKFIKGHVISEDNKEKQYNTNIINGRIKILVGVNKEGTLQGPYFGYVDGGKKLGIHPTSVRTSFLKGYNCKGLLLRLFKDDDELMMEDEDVVSLQKLGFKIEYLEN